MNTLRPPVLIGQIVGDWASALEVIGTVAALAAAITLGIVVFVRVRNRWRQLAEEPIPEAPIETYQQMLDAGLIDAQEFKRIVAQVGNRPAPAVVPPRAPATGIRAGPPPQPTDFQAGPPPGPPSD